MPSDNDPEFPPLVLTFAASDPSGGAGLQADILTLASMGCHPLSVVTAITVQDTLGVEGLQALDAEWVADQARCLLEDMPVDAFKIGVLGSVENIAAIAEIVSDYPDVPLILDPVLASGRGDELATEDMQRTRCASSCCRRRRSSRPTASRRAGSPKSTTTTNTSLAACAARADRDGLPNTCSSPARTSPRRRSSTRSTGKTASCAPTRGRACPAATTARDARSRPRSRRCSPTGSSLPEAVREAQDYTWQALKKAYRPGMGQFLPDRLFWARDESGTPAGEPELPRASDAGSTH